MAMLDNYNIITGKELDKLLADCPSDAYPDGITDSEDDMAILVDGKPLDHEAEYRVTRTHHHHRIRYPHQVKTIGSDWQVERLSDAEAEDRRKARIVDTYAGQPVAVIADQIAGWQGWYPVVDEDGDLTGEVVTADGFGDYEVTPCGNAVFATGVDQ
jgi:hypothetical protein